MMSRYEITLARPADLPFIGPIELAAAQLLRCHAPQSALDEVTSEEALRAAQRDDRLWVARTAGAPVGFAHVELVEPNAAHLEELDVHPDHGRRGVGARLVTAVCRWAADRGFDRVTLTTFRRVPWNMPFYARLGFEEIPPAARTPALQAIVQDETRRGLDPAQRVTMQWRCDSRQ
jgi:GNAT superfamily N-acetyltransferase